MTADRRPASICGWRAHGPAAALGQEFGIVYSSIFLWRDSRGIVIQIPPVGHVPLTLLDVDGETIAIEIWAGGDHVDQWLPTADKIVDSIRFLYRPPDETNPARPTTSP